MSTLSGSPIECALAIAFLHGQIDGAHHKAWVIDQMVRELTGAEYEAFVALYEDGGFEWEIGRAP